MFRVLLGLVGGESALERCETLSVCAVGSEMGGNAVYVLLISLDLWEEQPSNCKVFIKFLL